MGAGDSKRSSFTVLLKGCFSEANKCPQGVVHRVTGAVTGMTLEQLYYRGLFMASSPIQLTPGGAVLPLDVTHHGGGRWGARKVRAVTMCDVTDQCDCLGSVTPPPNPRIITNDPLKPMKTE